jgi:lysophospholipase L1-like esterase
LGVNDLFAACPTQDPTCVAGEIPVVGANLSAILAELRAAATPNTEIIVLLYYNPLFVANPATDALAIGLDSALGAAAAANGARTANAFPVINSTGLPGGSELANVCLFTLMCPGGDIHPSDDGYAAIAGVFWTASGYAKLAG